MQISQAILPVAGLGSRFLPWTKAVPKELLPIGNQPVVALLVDECLSIGIDRICFVINRGKEAIPRYFEQSPHLERQLKAKGKEHLLAEIAKYDNVKFHIAYQDEQKGDGHALWQAAPWVDSDHVAVLFGDDLIVGAETGLQQLVKAGAEVDGNGEKAMLCLQDVPKEDVSKYGIVGVEQDVTATTKKIGSLVEKPNPKDAPSTLAIVGKYIIPRSTFGILPTLTTGSHGGEIRLIDALMKQLEQSNSIYGCVFEGKRYDTGTPEGYREAVMELTK